MSENSTFQALSGVDMSEKHKKKNGMTYLPWSCAWAAIKQHDPLAKCEPVKTQEGCLYHTDGKTCWVETSMTIDGETQNETLAVMDHKNQSISLEAITSTAVNKSLKRCMVKNAALFGLDLNLWEGEELSDEVKRQRKEAAKKDEEAAAALNAVINEISALGSKLIAAGYSKDDMYAVVGKHNKGETNPGKLPNLDVANAVKTEFEKMLNAKSGETTTKSSTRRTSKKESE